MKKITALFLSIIFMTGFFGTFVSAAQKTGLSKTSITLEVGETASLRLIGATGKIKWSISDASVCKYKSGVVTAVGKGKAYIYATNNGKKYKCTVTVTDNGGKRSYDETVFDPSDYDSVVSLEPGVSAQIEVTTSGFGKIKIKNEAPSIISVKCGAVKNGRFTLSLKGKANGIGEILIYDGSNTSVKISIGVIVSENGAYSYSGAFGSSDESALSSEEFVDEVIRLVNEERRAAGLDPLDKSESLCDSAQLRAEEISGYFSHTRPDGTSCFTAITASYGYAGENIAMGQRTPDEVMECWMNSTGHKKNILGKNFKKIGVGYDSSSNSWVQIFTD